jgi:prepilin-type N-terminal cleavage/methylation domain-containing protein
MHVRTRPFLADERGFTLVELLVVVLMVGILAMIALPAFLGQRVKGQDTEAQQTLRTVATALATHEIGNDTFDVTRADLEAIEPAVAEASAALFIDGDADTFTIRETSTSETEFTLERAADGRVTRTCSNPEHGLCRAGGTW